MKSAVIYKVFVVILLFGMHAEIQMLTPNISGNALQVSSVELVIAFSCLFLLGYILVNKIKLEEIFKEKALFLVLCLFCLSLILSTTIAEYKLEAIKYDIRIIATLVLFYLVMQFLFREGVKGFALIVLNVVGVTVSLICILKYFDIAWAEHLFDLWGKGSRTEYSASVFNHNNVFGNWLVMLIFITLGQLKETTSSTHKAWLGASTALFVFTLPLTLSRSAWVAFILGSGIYLLIIKKNRKASIWLVSVILIFAISVFANSLAKKRIAETSIKVKNFQFDRITHRFDRWCMAIEIFKEYPILGIGLNNFRLQQKKFIPKELGRGKLSRRLANENLNAHNQYLNILAEQGAFGFIVFMAFVGYLVTLGIGNIRRGGNEFFALAIFAYLIGELFDYLWYDYSFIFMFWFVVILNILEKRRLDDVLLEESP